MSASRSASALTNAFQVACTKAAPNTIKKTSIAIATSAWYVGANTSHTHRTLQRHGYAEDPSQVAALARHLARHLLRSVSLPREQTEPDSQEPLVGRVRCHRSRRSQREDGPRLDERSCQANGSNSRALPRNGLCNHR